MFEHRSKREFRRKGFAFGLFAGVLYVAYREFKYAGSINRNEAMLCVAVVLAFGLIGGIIGVALGAVCGASDRDD